MLNLNKLLSVLAKIICIIALIFSAFLLLIDTILIVFGFTQKNAFVVVCGLFLLLVCAIIIIVSIKVLSMKKSTVFKYDLTTIEGIRAIPVPTKKKAYYEHDIREDIEYILQRKATEYKSNGQMDLAIECLKKSNEIMPYSSYMYMASDYYRLIEYLKKARRFDEARVEKQKLDSIFGGDSIPKDARAKINNCERIMAEAKQLGTDLVEMSEHHCTCGECAKYQGRVFSLSGKSKRFPKVPDAFFVYGAIHEGCRHDFYPFFEDDDPTYHENIIEYSNRPFVDNRSQEEIEQYEAEQKAQRDLMKDREDYDWIWEHLGDIAPKSFSGYRRMKNSNSVNYQKLCKAANEKGKNIG